MNRGNPITFYGKGGDITTNRRDEQELSVLCLQVLQSALVYVNTLGPRRLRRQRLGRPDDRRRLPRSHAPVLAPRRALP